MLYVICGLPGSGKTTLSLKIAEYDNARIYHYDEFKIGANPRKTKLTHKNMYDLIAQDLLDGHNVIIDDLHLTLEWRQDLLLAIKDIQCEKTLIVLTTPLEECLKRNSERKDRLPDYVIYHLNNIYEQPSIIEGWDDIYFIKNN